MGSLGTADMEAVETPLDIDPLLDDPATRIVVCCGAGGVGKTTTAAALGVRAAERGRRTVVLTIDPARRLAQSMGLSELDNTPREVPGVDTSAGGELHAMMLDMKRTFDEIVEAHAEPERARAILDNSFYQSLSAGFAGTQEYMAMEKLGQLRTGDEWDLIVVDTPPSRSALDFLDAPKRLGSFLDGTFIKLMMAPARVGGRAGMKFVNLGMTGLSMFTGALSKLLGAGLLRDVQTFVAAMDTMFGGFRTRADATYRLLQAPGTAFLVVAAPERDALREAAYFVERLAADRMPLAGLVLNRMHGSSAAGLSAERALAAAENLEAGGIVDRGLGKGEERNAPSAGPEGMAPEDGSPAAAGRGSARPATTTSRTRADGRAHDTTHAATAPGSARTSAPTATASAHGASADSAPAPGAPADSASEAAQEPTPTVRTAKADGAAAAAPEGRTSSRNGQEGAQSAREGDHGHGEHEWQERQESRPERRGERRAEHGGAGRHRSGTDTGSEADGTAASDGTAADESAADESAAGAAELLAVGLLRLHAERMRLLARERRTRDRFTALHPEVPVAEVSALPEDVHDLTGLRTIGERLARQSPGRDTATTP
ncbi:ArsA family ATPase [Streptomyces boncukensis]|uniref:AAA family ATPase n=1 Tax=Streptomyces boncukensis TaxID=2711219 RepID=A0A6G4WZJ9_9ACTN|nr:ArsA family ATPase [Streptomyces boncukensis]NGO70060.1 AAA family ATPase [Streptomyces boncukensis]